MKTNFSRGKGSTRGETRFPINPPARLSGSSGRSVLAKLVRAALAGIITVLLQAPQWRLQCRSPNGQARGRWTLQSARGLSLFEGSFGQTGPDDFERLPGTPASAKAFVVTISRSGPPIAIESEARVVVNFQRTFLLLDSPGGWIVSLNGELEGTLFTSEGLAERMSSPQQKLLLSPSRFFLKLSPIVGSVSGVGIAPRLADVFEFNRDQDRYRTEYIPLAAVYSRT